MHPQKPATCLLSYFMGCIALVRCVLVLSCGLVWVVWCGVVSGIGFQPAYGYQSTPAKTQRNTNTHRTRAIQAMK